MLKIGLNRLLYCLSEFIFKKESNYYWRLNPCVGDPCFLKHWTGEYTTGIIKFIEEIDSSIWVEFNFGKNHMFILCVDKRKLKRYLMP